MYAEPSTNGKHPKAKRLAPKPINRLAAVLPPAEAPRLRVYGDDLDNLRASGIEDGTIIDNGLYTVVGDVPLIARLLHLMQPSTATQGGLVIPYTALDGTEDGYAVVRPHNPRTVGGKVIKYENPRERPSRSYFPFSSRPLLLDGTSPVFVTEGVKKALALSQLGLAAVGLMGVDGFNVSKTDALKPELAAVPWTGREVFICYDFDPKETTRANVAGAAARLTKALQKAGAGAVYVLDLPPGPDGAKQGVDDFLVAFGPDAFRALVALARAPKPQTRTKGLTAAQALLEIALGEAELWTSTDDKAFATITREGGYREHYPIRSKAFRQWLGKRYYDQERSVAGSSTTQDVLDTLEGMAKFDGETFPLALRVGEHAGRVYLDLADEQWRAVEIDAEGWRIVDNPPVRFRRTKGMQAHPEPVGGGALAGLRPFVNVNDEGWPLYLAWLVSSLRPSGPFLVLKVFGEQGSAKSTFGEVSRRLLDPHVSPLRRPPANERDLMVCATNNWLVAYDNLSHVSPDISDALCCLATGGGFAARTLYTDDDETILSAERPILLNGIEEVGTRSDLMDRSLVVELPRIDAKKRKAEDAFWADFELARPRILGALLDALSNTTAPV